MCVSVYVCFLFYLFFAFLSPKYFLKKVILVRCWEKYRPLINSTLSGYKTAVSSSGMQDHPSASSGLGGNPIPSVSTLARAQDGSLIATLVSTRGQDTHLQASLQKGLREREKEREGGVWENPDFTSPVLSYLTRLTRIPQWKFTLLPLKLYFKPLYVCILSHALVFDI